MSLTKTQALLALGVIALIAGGGATSSDAATIAGKVTFGGSAPESRVIKMSADPNCTQSHPDGVANAPFTVSDGGGVADVVVYVKGVTGSHTAPTEAAVLDQNGCMYNPRAVALMVGQKLQIRNSDPTLHNIHPRPKKNAEFNVGQPRQGMKSTKTFSEAELLIPVACDVHPWMQAYISVFDHPFFAVTGADGSFEITGLAAGQYEVEAVHPTLKTVSGTITVTDGAPASLDLAYAADAAAK
jgi:plastocyanin